MEPIIGGCSVKFERYRKEHKKQFTALLLACTIMVTAVAATLLTPTAVAADLVISLGASNSRATPQQLRAGVGEPLYRIEDQYGTVWGVTNEVDIFKVSYENGSHEVTVAGKNNDKVIAPGTENTYTFALKNTNIGNLDYKVVVEAWFDGLDGTGKVIPVEAKLQGHYGWLVGNETTYRPVLELNGAEESAVLTGGTHAMYTLQWQWPFEHDLNGDGNIDDGDALDTWLATQDEEISLSIRITVLSTYYGSSAGGSGGGEEELPMTAPIPAMLNAVDHYAYLYGFHDGTIRPEADVTRAQVAAIFYRLLKTDIRNTYYSTDCDYPDVAEDAWYRTEISTLTAAGVFEGYSDGYFRGEQVMTRAEMAAVLARLSGLTISDEGRTAFKDIDGHWAQAEIETIEDCNWIEGYGDGTFRPDDTCSRAETATMINRMLHRNPRETEDLLPQMKTWPDNADPSAWYYLAMQEASNSHDYERLLGTRSKWIELIENPWEDAYHPERQ